MSKETVQIVISAITAGFISAGGSVIVVSVSGYAVTNKVLGIAAIIGVVQAAKDVRSMMHMPGVSDGGNNGAILSAVDKSSKPGDPPKI